MLCQHEIYYGLNLFYGLSCFSQLEILLKYIPDGNAPNVTMDGESVSVLELCWLEEAFELLEWLLVLPYGGLDEFFEYRLETELLLEDIENLALAGSGIWA